MNLAGVLPSRRQAFETLRQDPWWLQPVAVFAGLSAFIVYSTWAAFQNAHYTFGPYLSPFYAPELFGSSPHAWFGPKPSWIPDWLPFSPAFLILWAPGGFRLTCYYYRGAYYKAFWGDPPACAVGEPRNEYLGENSFPLILQNIHRYFLYVAIVFIGLLAWDAYKAFWWLNPATGATQFGIGLGTLILVANVCLLGSYTFGCHSLRHLVGGRLDEVSKVPACLTAYQCVTTLNRRHMLFAWLSLCSVGFSDIYIRCCSMGIFNDFRIL